MAYFDNAATTFPKPDVVYSFMNDYYKTNGASAGRGNYEGAVSACSLIAKTRGLIKDLLSCPAKEVVFTPTATIALNIIIQGIIQTGVKNIYISPFEHNAVTRTLHAYEKKGEIKVHKLAVTNELHFDIERIRYQFESVTPELVIVSHASNVFGLVAPATDIFTLALNNDMNTAYPDEYTTSGGMAFLLTLVTCGIYGLYWMYKMGSKIDKKENNGNNAILFLILSAIGLGVVNYCIIQDKLNNCSTIS